MKKISLKLHPCRNKIIVKFEIQIHTSRHTRYMRGTENSTVENFPCFSPSRRALNSALENSVSHWCISESKSEKREKKKYFFSSSPRRASPCERFERRRYLRYSVWMDFFSRGARVKEFEFHFRRLDDCGRMGMNYTNLHKNWTAINFNLNLIFHFSSFSPAPDSTQHNQATGS